MILVSTTHLLSKCHKSISSTLNTRNRSTCQPQASRHRPRTVAEARARRGMKHARGSTGSNLLAGVDVHGELDEAVGVAPLVVVPRDELDEGLVEADASLGVEGGRGGVRDEVVGDDLLVGVGHDALVLGRVALRLDERADLVVFGGPM